MMTSLTNSIMPDADVVLDLHRMGVWSRFLAANRVYLAETVSQEAAFYETTVYGVPKTVYVDLDPDILNGQITLRSATASMLAPVQKSLRAMRQEVHTGELEMITLVCNGMVDGALMCFIDEGAITSAVLLGLARQCISVEDTLAKCGLGRSVPRKCSTERFEGIVRSAEIKRVNFLTEPGTAC